MLCLYKKVNHANCGGHVLLISLINVSMSVVSILVVRRGWDCLNTIRKGRTVLGLVCHILAAYRLAKTKYWKQLRTTGTLRWQSQLMNVVINQLNEMGECVSILLTTNIIPESEDSEKAHDSILKKLSIKNSY